MKVAHLLEESSKPRSTDKSSLSASNSRNIGKGDRNKQAVQPFAGFASRGERKSHIPKQGVFKPSAHSCKAGVLMISTRHKSHEGSAGTDNAQEASELPKYIQMNQFLKVTCSNLREKAKGLMENCGQFRQNFSEIINRYKKVYEKQFLGLFKTEQTQKIMKRVTEQYNLLVAAYNRNMAQLKFFRDIFIDYRSLKEEKLAFYETFLEKGLENIKFELLNRKGRFLQKIRQENKIIEEDDDFFRVEPAVAEPRSLEQFLAELTQQEEKKKEADLDAALKKRLTQEELELNALFFKNIKTERSVADSFSHLLEPNDSGSEAKESSANNFLKQLNFDNTSDRSMETRHSSMKKNKSCSNSKLRSIVELTNDSSKSLYELLLREKSGPAPANRQLEETQRKRKADSAGAERKTERSELGKQRDNEQIRAFATTENFFEIKRDSTPVLTAQKRSQSAANFFQLNEKRRLFEEKNKCFREKSARERREASDQFLREAGTGRKNNSMVAFADLSEVRQEDPTLAGKLQREIEEIRKINGCSSSSKAQKKRSPLKMHEIYQDLAKRDERDAAKLKMYTQSIIKRERPEDPKDRSCESIASSSKKEKLSAYLEKIIRTSEREPGLNGSLTIKNPYRINSDSNGFRKTQKSSSARSASSEAREAEAQSEGKATKCAANAYKEKEETNILSKISTWKRAALESFIRNEVLSGEDFRKAKAPAEYIETGREGQTEAPAGKNGDRARNELPARNIVAQLLPPENKAITPSWNGNLTSNTNTSLEAMNSTDQSRRRSREERMKKKLDST